MTPSAPEDYDAYLRLESEIADSPPFTRPAVAAVVERNRLRTRLSERIDAGLPGVLTLERGVPVGIQTTVDRFLGVAGRLPSAAPGIRRLRPWPLGFLTHRMELERLAASPALARLRSLDFGHAVVFAPGGDEDREIRSYADVPSAPESVRVGDDVIEFLSRSPHLRGLRRLQLSSSGVTAKGLREIGAWTGLEVLDLGSNPLDDDAAAVLASARLPALRELGLGGTRVGSKGFAALGRAYPKLERLGAGLFDSFWEGELTAIASAFPSLASLKIQGGRLGASGAKAIARLEGLRELSVCCDAIGDSAARFAELGRLRRLEIRSRGVGPRAVSALAAALDHLEELILVGARFDAASAKALAGRKPLLAMNLAGLQGDAAGFTRALKQPLLRRLLLFGSTLGDDGVRGLAEGAHCPRLDSLSLEDVGMGEAGARALAASTGLAGLRHLNISRNRIGNGGVAALASSKTLASLEELEASWMDLDFRSGGDWTAAPKGLPSLRSLGLRDSLGSEAQEKVASSVHMAGLLRVNGLGRVPGVQEAHDMSAENFQRYVMEPAPPE